MLSSILSPYGSLPLPAEEGVSKVLGLVSRATDVPPDQILSEARGSSKTAHARHIAMYLCHTLLGLSLGATARCFSRDPSTIRHACAKIEQQRDDLKFDHWLCQIEHRFQQEMSHVCH